MGGSISGNRDLGGLLARIAASAAGALALAVFAASGSLFASGPLLAQDAPSPQAGSQDAQDAPDAQTAEHVAQYRLFREAQERGDFDAAAIHGEAAWKAAEEALGDHELTAILAYNFGYHIVFVAPGQAKPALARARALADAGYAELPSDLLELLVSYADFATKEPSQEETEEARRFLKRLERSGMGPSEELARFWYRVAAAQMAHGRYRGAGESAERAEEVYEAAELARPRFLAQILLAQSLSLVSRRPLTDDNVENAHEILNRAYALFEPQRSIDDFDPLFGLIVAWNSAVHALADSWPSSSGFRAGGPGPRPRLTEPDGAPTPILQKYTDADWAEKFEACGLEWESRPSPQYPDEALGDYIVGAILIGYHLSDGLAPQEIRVIAEAPRNRFGAESVAAVAKWRLKEPVPDRPECRRDFTVIFNYQIR